MIKNILIVAILIATSFSIVNAADINPPYTEGFNVINHTLTEDTNINIPSGNVIDSIVFKPTFYTAVTGTYNISCIYYCNDIRYEDNYKSDISTSIFHVISNKYEYNIRHMADTELSYQKQYETYVSKYCWFPIKITSFFGSHSNNDEMKVVAESEIFSTTGIKRTTDVFDIYNTVAYTASNYTITHEGFTDLDVIITYKLVGIHTTEFYIGQLNPTLKNLYKLGFAWLDKELYILNIFIITDKLISMTMFWVAMIAKSFIPLLFICMIFGVPLAAYYNSRGRKGFVSNLVTYYGLFFNGILNFIRYVIMILLRVLEIVRSLIPWI